MLTGMLAVSIHEIFLRILNGILDLDVEIFGEWTMDNEKLLIGMAIYYFMMAILIISKWIFGIFVHNIQHYPPDPDHRQSTNPTKTNNLILN